MRIVLFDDDGNEVQDVEVPEVLADIMMTEVRNILMNTRY